MLRNTFAAAFASLFVVLVLGIALMTTQVGVDLVVRELAVRSGGALEVDGATGTLLDTVQARRIAWRGTATKVEATDVALTWRPWSVFSRGILVHALGARALTIDIEPADSAVQLPENLALPIDIVIERLAVGVLSWRVGTGHGKMEGLEFGYAGGASAHRMTDLRVVTKVGTLTGDATLGTGKPFALDGTFKLAGDAMLRDARINLAAKGTLASLAVDVDGRAGEGFVSGHATLAPLADVPLVALSLDARDIDLAAWDRALPTTRLAATIKAQPADGGLAGTIEATNALAGNFAAARIPFRAITTRFAWHADVLALDDFSAELEGGAKATGKARIGLGDRVTGGNWTLDIRDLNARQLYAPLVETRLAGSIVADLDPKRRTVSGNLADRGFPGGLAVNFAASFDEVTIEIARFQARVSGGELAGHGRLDLDGQRAFAFDATATHLDPSRIGAYPAASLDGKVTASGVLNPAWRVDADVVIAQGSLLSGKPLHGTVRGTATPNRLRDAAVELSIGSATVKASGSVGEPGDHITATLDAPHLAELVPLLPAAIPRTLDGALQVKAQMAGAPLVAGFDVTAKGSQLKLGDAFSIGALDAHVVVAPSSVAGTRADFTSRTLRLDVDATGIKTPSGDAARANARVAGTLAAHTVTLSVDGGDIGVDAAAHGGLLGDPGADAPTALSWSGTIDSLLGRGPWSLRLASPTAVSFGQRKARVGEAHLSVADGTVDIGEFLWDEGRITSRGRFAAVPIATVARLAGRPLPVLSTLTLGGDWSLAATPRLTGTVSVHREKGDLWLVRESEAGPANLAAGVTALEASAQMQDDAVQATAKFRSARGGSADATLTIGADANAPPGRISPDAPLALTLVADLTSLELLQPWAGTTALVDGRVHLDLAAHGTMRDAPVSGTVKGTNLRIDAAQYGLHFKNGRVDAHIDNRRVTLDELAFTAGDGDFRATGTFAAGADAAASAASVKWHAEKFRVFNRPDFNLVVSGTGELALTKGKVSLTGALKADEGRFVYQFDSSASLGDDVVVKGWPERSPDVMRSVDIPLVIDVNLDFGDKLTFLGRGLDSSLRGEVRVRNGPGGFTGKGTIYTVNGTYFAYGQRLAIDPGRLVFDGPLDNPALDIIALRRNLAVEAGVQVTGTVRVPIIALTSNPPVPDSEKLSWLVLGQGIDRTSGTDLAALQAASAALLGPNSKPVTAGIAQSMGLDDISFRSGTVAARNAARGTPDASGQIVSIGKRLSESLTVAWEQGLTVATNALRVEYSLSNSLSVRAEAGTVSGIGLFYRRSFE
ncbi:MAG: translocation/assembly module TamB domain-containing protein [Casimicrobiaceae bacterium]